MRRTILVLFFFSICFFSQAQKVTISGYVSDQSSGERLIGANIYHLKTQQGTTSNQYGFYSLSLPAGETELLVSFIGYEPQTLHLTSTDQVINIQLKPNVGELSEINIHSTLSQLDNTQMSTIELPLEKMKSIPVILGEADVLKILQLMPGVQSGAEGTSGIYVRGGGPDQNLFLLDGVPVYNASHLMGFFSVFNPDAIKSVTLYKGGFPAHFGGRLSSVVDVNTKDGNMKELHGDLSVGLIASKLMLEGPIIKDKTSFMLSARRTYLDALAQPVLAIMNLQNEDNIRGAAFFHDINLKVNHIFSERSRLYLSGYSGLDKVKIRDNGATSSQYDYKNLTYIAWGNSIASLRWNYLFSNKLFSNTTLTYSHYIFDTKQQFITENSNENYYDEELFRYYSGINDYTAKIDFDYFPSPLHSLKFGTALIHHQFSPGVTRFKYENSDHEDENSDMTYGNRSVYANEWSTYIEDEITLTPKLAVNAGINLSAYFVDQENYFNPQPRLSAHYKVNPAISLKASYSRMVQYVHLLYSSGINLPTDLWVPVTSKYAPPISDQFALGISTELPKGFRFSSEAFYKKMTNLIAYKEGASFIKSGTEWEDKVESGKGWSYGIEFMIEKTIGKTTGWLGYTWSKSDRRFNTINFGKVFPAKYDRRHDISLVLTHKFNDKIDMGVTWVYGTGNAITLAKSEYKVADIPGYEDVWDNVPNYESRNNYRMPAYHRLDAGINFHKQKRHGIRTWNISVYNVYNRKNPFILYWDSFDNSNTYGSEPGNFINNASSGGRLIQFSLFPIIPSVSYSLKF